MSDDKLGPDDPTPDPDPESADTAVEGSTEVHPAAKGTTFVNVGELKEAAAEAAGKIDLSDGVQAEEVVDAALEATRKVTPTTHHAITELRKLLVPIVTAIISALAAGGFADWRATQAKEAAIKESEIRSEERRKAIEELKFEIRKSLIENSSWDEVGKIMTPSPEEVVANLVSTGAVDTGESPPVPSGEHAAPLDPRHTPRAGAKIPLELARDIVNQEIQQIKLVPNELRAAPR